MSTRESEVTIQAQTDDNLLQIISLKEELTKLPSSDQQNEYLEWVLNVEKNYRQGKLQGATFQKKWDQYYPQTAEFIKQQHLIQHGLPNEDQLSELVRRAGALSPETNSNSTMSSSEDASPLEMEAIPCDEKDLLNRLKSKDNEELKRLLEHLEYLETNGIPVLLDESEKEKLQTLMPKLAEIKATAQFKIDLLDYKEKREANQNQYLTFFGRYTPSFCSTAYSRDEKISAVDALLNNYSVDEKHRIPSILNEHAGAFNQGRLGDIVTSYNEKIESLQSDNTFNEENGLNYRAFCEGHR